MDHAGAPRGVAAITRHRCQLRPGSVLGGRTCREAQQHVLWLIPGTWRYGSSALMDRPSIASGAGPLVSARNANSAVSSGEEDCLYRAMTAPHGLRMEIRRSINALGPYTSQTRTDIPLAVRGALSPAEGLHFHDLRSLPWANGPPMARKINNCPGKTKAQTGDCLRYLGLSRWSGWRESNSHYQLGKRAGTVRLRA
jgi:hypothetical protein